jgi:RNA polymerase sigma-70 factor (ECF subfamily)
MISSVQKNRDGNWNEMEFRNGNSLDPHQEIMKMERLQALSSALSELQTTCRNSITLFYIRNLSYREIADRLGVSVNTVGSRLSKCLNKLQNRLRQDPLFERTTP